MTDNPKILSEVEAAYLRGRSEVREAVRAALIDVPRYDMESDTDGGVTGATMAYRVNGDWILFDEAMKILDAISVTLETSQPLP